MARTVGRGGLADKLLGMAAAEHAAIGSVIGDMPRAASEERRDLVGGKSPDYRMGRLYTLEVVHMVRSCALGFDT